MNLILNSKRLFILSNKSHVFKLTPIWELSLWEQKQVNFYGLNIPYNSSKPNNIDILFHSNRLDLVWGVLIKSF